MNADVKSRCRESFAVWKLFVEAGFGDRTTSYSTTIPSGYFPLVDCFFKVNSQQFEWVVDLELVDLKCSSADFKALSVLCNLRTLFVRYTSSIERHQQSFDDSVIDAIASRAALAKSLTRLEMLFVEGAPDMTARAFHSLKTFPALRLCCVLATGISTRSTNKVLRHGWQASTR